MPYYLVEFTLTDGKCIRGVKPHKSQNVDFVWKDFKEKTQMHYKIYGFHSFDCKMLSKHSPLFRKYLDKKGIHYDPFTMVAQDPDYPGRA